MGALPKLFFWCIHIFLKTCTVAIGSYHPRSPSSITWCLNNRPEVAAVPSVLSPTPLIIILKKSHLAYWPQTRYLPVYTDSWHHNLSIMVYSIHNANCSQCERITRNCTSDITLLCGSYLHSVHASSSYSSRGCRRVTYLNQSQCRVQFTSYDIIQPQQRAQYEKFLVHLAFSSTPNE
jgi:hypothetical protein